MNLPGAPFVDPRVNRRSSGLLLVGALAALSACSQGPTTAGKPIAAAAPPRDDGKPAKGGNGGFEHAAALEQLTVAPLIARSDRQNSIRIQLPDAAHWTSVKFWSVKSLAGFRYGKEHHAIVAAFLTRVPDSSAPDACKKSFEELANPWIQAFEVDLATDLSAPFQWASPTTPAPLTLTSESVFATTATLADHDTYGGAYAIYPAWKGACLIIGVAVPSRGDDPRARAVRDRFAKEILPKVELTRMDIPPDQF